ncbi:ATP-binding protein [Ramlibacter sp. MAHUQ-53]|uniref:ATP-binding protein n=1 Tax=unclassified Ramlibacter TaxID=2617605 RepID=UPI003643CFC2
MPAAPRAQPLKVILAGSDAQDREWVGELLRSGAARACAIHPAADGEQALHLARSEPCGAPPGHLLLAAPLAGTDPLDLVARLAGDGGVTACPVVVITPGTGRELGPRLLRAGAQDYIGEGWLSPYVLARAVDNALVRWSMEQELRERDAALQRSEAFARGVLNSLPQHVLVLDDEGAVRAANESWERFSRDCPGGGLPGAQVGANYLEACHRAAASGDAGAGEILQALRALLAGQGQECVVEHARPCPGQPPRWFLMHARRPFHGHGLILSHVDISARKQAEEQLRHAQRLTQTIIDGAGALVFAKDLEGRYFLTNRAWRERMGLTEQQAHGATDEAVFGPQTAEALRRNDRQVLASGRLMVAEETTWLRGRPVTYLSSKFPLVNEEGQPYAVCGVSTDVTEQKRVEKRLAGLLEEERRHARLLARMAEAARLMHASLSAEEIAHVLTQQAREILGAQHAATSLAPAGPGARAVEALSQAGDEAPGPDAARLAASLAGPGGQALGQVRLAGRPGDPFGPADEAVLVQMAAIASTCLDNARLVASLREADHRKDEFLATLAHELRNPLAPIRNGLEVLRRSGQLAGPAARARDMMERQLAHMVRLVDDLLDVSRISRGKVDLRIERITLQAVLENALEASRPALEDSRHHLALQVPPEPLWVDGDLTRLAQVVSNLLNNAAKYTPAGGHIGLSARDEGGHAAVRVTDDGTGISAEMLPRVFDLFAQAGGTLAQAQGGLGIGLSLVRQLVELHGGEVGAESAGLGQGSRFTVRLPLAAPPAAAAPAPATGAAGAGAGTGRRILVVDDNVDGAESLAMMLSLSGHEVRTCHDGPAALALAPGWRPEVVLLDIGLPGLSGYEVAQRLRAGPLGTAALLVAVTGWGAEDDQRRAAEAGFDHHLTKPVDIAALESVLARRRQPAGAA